MWEVDGSRSAIVLWRASSLRALSVAVFGSLWWMAAPQRSATVAISVESVETIISSKIPDFCDRRIERSMRVFPPTSWRFFLGIPLDPPRAGMIAVIEKFKFSRCPFASRFQPALLISDSRPPNWGFGGFYAPEVFSTPSFTKRSQRRPARGHSNGCHNSALDQFDNP